MLVCFPVQILCSLVKRGDKKRRGGAITSATFYLKHSIFSNLSTARQLPATTPRQIQTRAKLGCPKSIVMPKTSLPLHLRNSDHGDILMFKNHLDIFLSDIPDEPTVQGLTRAAISHSLLAQIPLVVGSRIVNPMQP